MKLLFQFWKNLMFPSFFGIGEGPSGGEKKQLGETGALANFATSTGEGDIGAASDFWRSILSGDSNAISRVLGPQISGINKRGQESIKTASEFGNRSGGTNAANQMVGDNTRSEVNSLISGLTGGAASALGSMGQGLLSTGLGAHESAFGMEKTIHDQHLAKMNDIFKSIAEVAGSVFGGFGGAGAAPLAFPGGAAQVAGSSGGSLAQPITDTYTGPETIS